MLDLNREVFSKCRDEDHYTRYLRFDRLDWAERQILNQRYYPRWTLPEARDELRIEGGLKTD